MKTVMNACKSRPPRERKISKFSSRSRTHNARPRSAACRRIPPRPSPPISSLRSMLSTTHTRPGRVVHHARATRLNEGDARTRARGTRTHTCPGTRMGKTAPNCPACWLGRLLTLSTTAVSCMIQARRRDSARARARGRGHRRASGPERDGIPCHVLTPQPKSAAASNVLVPHTRCQSCRRVAPRRRHASETSQSQ